MRRRLPSNKNRFFAVRITTQGKPCSGPVLALFWPCSGPVRDCSVEMSPVEQYTIDCEYLAYFGPKKSFFL